MATALAPELKTQDDSKPGKWNVFKTEGKNEPNPAPQAAPPEPAKKETTPPAAPANPPVATPPAATPPAPDPDDDIDPGNKIESGQEKVKNEDWKRAKSIAKTERNQRRELEKAKAEIEAKHAEIIKQLEHEKSAPKHNAQLIKELSDERDKYKTMYSEVALEVMPEFNAKYESRFGEATAGLRAMVGDKADKVIAALQLPDGEHKNEILEKLTEGMNELQKGEIVATNRDIRRINTDRSNELKQANEKLGKIAQERQSKLQERVAAENKEFEIAIARLQDTKEGLPGFILKGGNTPEDAAYNASVNERLQVSRKIFTGDLPPAERARQAALAALGPSFLEQIKHLSGELEKANSTITKLQASNPGMGAGAQPKKADEKRGWAARILEPVSQP